MLGVATRLDLEVHLGFDEIRDLWLLRQFTKFSHHTTAVAAAGLCLPLIFPSRGRHAAALLAFAMSAGIALMLLIRGTHLLTDLVAALLVAGFWAVVGAQALAAHASS